MTDPTPQPRPQEPQPPRPTPHPDLSLLLQQAEDRAALAESAVGHYQRMFARERDEALRERDEYREAAHMYAVYLDELRTRVEQIADRLAEPPPIVYGTAQDAYRYVVELLRGALRGESS